MNHWKGDIDNNPVSIFREPKVSILKLSQGKLLVSVYLTSGISILRKNKNIVSAASQYMECYLLQNQIKKVHTTLHYFSDTKLPSPEKIIKDIQKL